MQTVPKSVCSGYSQQQWESAMQDRVSELANVETEIDAPAATPASNRTIRRRILFPQEAAAAVRRGIIRAARDCEMWGGDWPSDRGCENLLQVRAADEIHTVMSDYSLGWVTLEEPMSNLTEGGTRKRGRPHLSMTDQQRADIAIWTRSYEIYALIEIKRTGSAVNWESDLHKLGKLLNRYGRRSGRSLRYAVFGAFISSKSGAEIKSRLGFLNEIARSVATKYGLSAKTELDEDKHYWSKKGVDDWTCSAASVIFRSRN